MLTNVPVNPDCRITVTPTFDKRGQVTITMTPVLLQTLHKLMTEPAFDPNVEEFREKFIVALEDALLDCAHL